MEMSKALDRMGDTAMQREDEEDDIGAAFQKFAVVTKELGVLMKNMVSYLHIGTITPVPCPWACRKIITNDQTGKYLALIPGPQRAAHAFFGKW